MCEAFATMETKCEDIAGGYMVSVKLCMVTPVIHRHSTIPLELNIDVAQKCAIETTSCEAYHQCAYGHD